MYRLMLCLALVGCRAWRERREAADDSSGSSQDEGGSGASSSGGSSGGGSEEGDADPDSDADSGGDSGHDATGDGGSDAGDDDDGLGDDDGHTDDDGGSDSDGDSDSDADPSGRYEGVFTLHVVGSVVELGYDVDDTCVGTAEVDVDSAGIPEIIGDVYCNFDGILAGYVGEQRGSVEGAVEEGGEADGTVTFSFGSASLSATWAGATDGLTLTGTFSDVLTYPIGAYSLEATYTGEFSLAQ